MADLLASMGGGGNNDDLQGAGFADYFGGGAGGGAEQVKVAGDDEGSESENNASEIDDDKKAAFSKEDYLGKKWQELPPTEKLDPYYYPAATMPFPSEEKEEEIVPEKNYYNYSDTDSEFEDEISDIKMTQKQIELRTDLTNQHVKHAIEPLLNRDALDQKRRRLALMPASLSKIPANDKDYKSKTAINIGVLHFMRKAWKLVDFFSLGNKNTWVAYMLWYWFGKYGAHRFYLGKP